MSTNDKKRHQLRLLGITYNQIESGVYAMILEEVNGDRRIPIVIGYPEAQAIECKLQEVQTPRPLAHDLLKSVLEQFNLVLRCVDIYRLPNGVFAANLMVEGQDGDFKVIDARSSDAVALALRTGAPIYTTAEVIEEAGFKPNSAKPSHSDPQSASDTPEITIKRERSAPKIAPVASFDDVEGLLGEDAGSNPEADGEKDVLEFLSNFTDKEIERQIARFAAEEKYEVAGRLKSLLAKLRQTRG